MHISTKISTVAASALLFAASAVASPFEYAPSLDLSKFVYKGKKTENLLKSERLTSFEALTAKDKSEMRKAEAFDPKPEQTFSGIDTFGDIDGPDNTVWFYTLNCEYDAIKHEYFTEYIFKSFVAKIYDNNLQFIGEIKDDFEYHTDEVRTVYNDLLPVVTKNYFNSDDKYELIMGFVINSSTPGINHSRSIVYQIGGEKDADGNDKPITTLSGLVSNVQDATVAGGPETFYFTFINETSNSYNPDDPNNTETSYWDGLMNAKMIMNVFGKADAEGNLTKVMDYSFPIVMMPGNMETVPYCMSFMHGNDAMMLFQHYGESFFNPYYSYDEDLTMRENNSLVIDIYKLADGKATLDQTTVIPFSKADEYPAQFYSVGDLMYYDDVNYDHYGDGKKAGFIVTRQDKASLASDEATGNYYVYNPDGTFRTTIFENAQTAQSLSEVKGCEPQMLFVDFNGLGEYQLNFIDMYSLRTVAKFSYAIPTEDYDEPEYITTNLDRVAYGDSYAYVGEFRFPLEEDDHTILRLAWLDKTGKHMFTDEVDMGENVQFGQPLVSSAILKPDVFHSDENREYMFLVKRGISGSVLQEELMIAQVRNEGNDWLGKTLLHLTPDEEKGALTNITPYVSVDIPYLSVAYGGHKGVTGDFYYLPLDKTNPAGIDKAPAAEASAITFDGTTVKAQGENISVYNLQGIIIAEGHDSLDITALPAGAYIAKTSQGALKFIK